MLLPGGGVKKTEGVGGAARGLAVVRGREDRRLQRLQPVIGNGLGGEQ
jgi:hypothetical protein